MLGGPVPRPTARAGRCRHGDACGALLCALAPGDVALVLCPATQSQLPLASTVGSAKGKADSAGAPVPPPCARATASTRLDSLRTQGNTCMCARRTRPQHTPVRGPHGGAKQEADGRVDGLRDLRSVGSSASAHDEADCSRLPACRAIGSVETPSRCLTLWAQPV